MANQAENNSLWNRSKKAFGGRSFTFLQHQPKASEATSQLSGRSDDQSAKAAHARRREQVRRAQRNHRERKENYIKSLEREVLRLREEEAEIVQNSKAVQEENAMLREILSQHRIPIPDRTAVLKYVATVSVRDFTEGGQCLQVTMPEMTDYSYPAFDSFTPPFSTSMETSSPDSGNIAVPQSREISAQPSERSFQNEPLKRQAVAGTTSLDNPQIGIDFVLSLEQPCLGHTRGDGGASSGVPSGHALTAQAPLLSSAPPTLTPSSSWQIPAIEIDRLLDLSSQLNLMGEVTPVQAWARLRAHPRFEKLGRNSLEGLKQALMIEVHCYGFGAVIDEGVFEDLLQQAFYGL